MSRRADVGQMLAVSGNSAEYAVEVSDFTEGERTQTVISRTSLAGADDWTPVPKVTVGAGRLHPGDIYRIRILSIYKTGTSVVATGSADYDDVVLRTAASEEGNAAENGDGSAGRKSLRSGKPLRLFSAGLSKAAIVSGGGHGKAKRLLVKVNYCPRQIGHACQVTGRACGASTSRRPPGAPSSCRRARATGSPCRSSPSCARRSTSASDC